MQVEIKIDVTDWARDAEHEEIEIADEEDLFALTDQGYTVGQIARATLALRALGRTPEDILRPDKMLLYGGACRNIAEKHEKRTLAGMPVDVREYVGKAFDAPDKRDPDAPYGYVQSISEEGLRLAIEYLEKVVLGHVVTRLRIIAANQGDVEGAASALCERIMSVAYQTVAEMETVEA